MESEKRNSPGLQGAGARAPEEDEGHAAMGKTQTQVG